MTYNIVCHVRITPIRGIGLTVRDSSGISPPSHPLIMGQINPWKVKRKSKPVNQGGSDPVWPTDKRSYIDLPYYGHPLPGEQPSITLILVDNQGMDDDEDIDAVSFKRIGSTEIKLAPFLNEKKDIKHDLELSLKNKKGQNAGVFVCSLQFVLTGKIRLTVLSGLGLRSVAPHPDQEPYVEARLSTSKKIKTTNSVFGENPKWGDYTRQPSLLGFASTRFFNTASQVPRRKDPNVLEFKFYDEDRSTIPVITCLVKDKMDSLLKQEKREKVQQERMRKIEEEIRALKAQDAKTRQEKMLSQKKKARQFSLFSAFRSKEADTPVPLTEEEQEMANKFAELLQKKEMANDQAPTGPQEDRLIGKGAVDLRQILTFDGIREAKPITIELLDGNELASGTLSCELEFENLAYDSSRRDVLRMPDFDDFSLQGLLSLNMKGFFRELHKVMLYIEIQLDSYAPPFIIRTSQQTGVSRSVLTVGSILVTFFAFTSLWFGLGSRTISYLLGTLYPTYQSYKALETRSHEEGTQWLTYWIVYGSFNFFENTALRPFVFLYPLLFYMFKISFIMWLIEPNSLGATLIYHMFLAPLIRRHEDDIDEAFITFGEAAKEAAKDFSGIRSQLRDEFRVYQRKQSNYLELEEDDVTDGLRVFIALLDAPDEPKMMIIPKRKDWGQVLNAVSKKFGMSGGEAELVMLLKDESTIPVDEENRIMVREDDKLYLKQAE